MSRDPGARLQLAQEVRRYLTEELKLSLSACQRASLEKPEAAVLVEFAHTPHFGHLGFIRMLLVALQQAAARPAGVLLFCLNDHVRADALPTLRHIPVWRDGKPLRLPPRLGISAADSDRPLLFVPPPHPDALLNAQKALREVLAFKASRGPRRGRKESIQKLPELFDWLAEQSVQTTNLANWATRCLLIWLQEIHPQVPIWPLASRRLTRVLPQTSQELEDRRRQVAQIQDEWSLRQGDWPEWSQMRPAGEDYHPFHALCHTCRRLLSLAEEHAHPVEWAPKVIARQPLADGLGLSLRVAGGERGYWGVAREVGDLLKIPPTPRLCVTGGIELSDPNGDEPCPSTLRVLAQSRLQDWFKPLVGPASSDNLSLSWPTGGSSC